MRPIDQETTATEKTACDPHRFQEWAHHVMASHGEKLWGQRGREAPRQETLCGFYGKEWTRQSKAEDWLV